MRRPHGPGPPVRPPRTAWKQHRRPPGQRHEFAHRRWRDRRRAGPGIDWVPLILLDPAHQLQAAVGGQAKLCQYQVRMKNGDRRKAIIKSVASKTSICPAISSFRSHHRSLDEGSTSSTRRGTSIRSSPSLAGSERSRVPAGLSVRRIDWSLIRSSRFMVSRITRAISLQV